MPQGTDPLNPDLPSGRTPTMAVDPVTGKVTGCSSSLCCLCPSSRPVPYSSPQGAESIPVSFLPCQTLFSLWDQGP